MGWSMGIYVTLSTFQICISKSILSYNIYLILKLHQFVFHIIDLNVVHHTITSYTLPRIFTMILQILNSKVHQNKNDIADIVTHRRL